MIALSYETEQAVKTGRLRMIRFPRNENGARAIEYGLIASLIAVAIVDVLVTLGPALKGVFQIVQNNL